METNTTAMRGHNWRLLLWTIGLICLAILALTAMMGPLSHDAFWHLSAGRDWLQNGLDPWHDHSSFTFPEAPVASPPYLFQAGLYLIVSLFGVDLAFSVFKGFAYLLIFSAMFFYLKSVRAPDWVWLVAFPLLTLLIQLRPMVRPELLSYSLMILAFWLYSSTPGIPTRKQLLTMVGLMLFWGNYHTPIVGYVIFAGFFIDYAHSLWRQRSGSGHWLEYLGWGVLVVLVGFLNPDFKHSILTLVAFSPEWQEIIFEYRSPLHLANLAGLYVLPVLALVTLVLAVRNSKWGFVLICGVMVYSASRYARMVTPAGVALICMFAMLATQATSQEIALARKKYFRQVMQVTVAVLVVLPLWTSISAAMDFKQQQLESEQRFPRAMAAYMKERGNVGRIFNPYGIGGFVTWAFGTGTEIYIDGRTNILYPLDHYLRWEAAHRDPAILQAEIEIYDIDFIIVENHPMAERYMRHASGFKLDFEDHRYVLLSKDNAGFAETGQLRANPACWGEEVRLAVSEEYGILSGYLPVGSNLADFLKLVSTYSESANWNQFTESLGDITYMPDSDRRFVGFRALDEGSWALALALFTTLQRPTYADLLAAAYAAVSAGETDRATEIVLAFDDMPEEALVPREMTILERIRIALGNGTAIQNIGTEGFCNSTRS